jgi:plastocyanin/uncharacterized protein YjdB
MNPFGRWVLAGGVAAGAAAIALSCGGAKDSTSPGPTVAAVVITSPAAAPTLATLGRTVPFAAQARDASGNAVTGQTITWTSSNTAVATIAGTGVATAVGNGTTTIRATAGGQSGSIVLTIAQVVVQVAVSPATFSMGAKGSARQLTATPQDSGGSVVSGATVTWASTNAAAVTVSAGGLATAVANGTAQITATAGGIPGSAQASVAIVAAQVAVTPASATFAAVGRTGQFGASASDSNGNAIAGKTFTWASSNSAVATVSTTGLATAVANGTAQVRATADGVTGSASLTVNIAVATVTLTPTSATLTLINQTRAITGTAKDSGGATIANPQLTWTSRAAAVFTVDTLGTVKALQEGSGYVVAAATTGAKDSSLITVSVYYASITVAPASVTLTALGAAQQLTATVKDSNGTAVPNAAGAFTVTGHGDATVSSSGLVTANAVGSDTVTATARTASTTVPVTVRQDVASISVTPSSATLATQGRTVQFAAAALDANSHPIPGTTFTWASTGTGVATVDATGLATAVNDGTAQIQASAGGKTGSGSLTVARVVVSAAVQSANLRKLDTLTTLGGTLAYTGTATDSSGATITGKSFAWVSRTTATATVSPQAGSATTATAVANGSTFIVGTVGTKSDSATLVVNSPLATTASVTVGDDFFKSVRNGTLNPAVDTIAVNGTVTWNWVGGSGISHSVQSTGTPSFTSSVIQTSGSYAFTFTAPGTYTYDCAVHGIAMRGTVVVK